MAVQSSPVLPQTPRLWVSQFSTGNPATTVANSTTTLVTAFIGGVNGTKVTSVMASNTSTSAAINAILTIGSTNLGSQHYFPIGSVTLPALSAGFDTPLISVNLFANPVTPLPIDGDGNPYLFLGSTAYALAIGVSSAPQTAASYVSFTFIGADF